MPSTDFAVRSLAIAIEQPIEVDRVRVGEDGHLWPRTGTEPIRFTFTDRGQRYFGRLVRVGGHARLHLSAAIGRVPYSIESRDGRKRVLDAMRNTRGLALGRLVVGPQQTVCLEGELAFEVPVTPDRLIAAAAHFVAGTRHAVERVVQAMPAPKPGRVN